MKPLFRDGLAAYLRDISVTFTLTEGDGRTVNTTLTCDPPLTENARRDLEQLAEELGETVVIRY